MVLVVFQGLNLHKIIMQLIKQLQWTATIATLENLIFFGKQQGAIRTDRKVLFSSSLLILHGASIFKVATSLSWNYHTNRNNM